MNKPAYADQEDVSSLEAIVTTSEGLEFDTDTGTITGYNGSASTLNIPSTISDVSVEYIGVAAFGNCTTLTEVTLPSTLVTIGGWGFSGCTNLSSINFPEGLNEIGDYSFQSCRSLDSISLPNSLQVLGEWAFSWCSGITTVTIPSQVSTIRYGPFANSTNIENVFVNGTNSNYKDIDGVLFTYDGTKLVQYPLGNSRTIYSLPADTTTIGYHAFSEASNLEEIDLNEGVKVIQSYGFSSCEKLRTINFPSTVEEIQTNSFYHCIMLNNVKLNEGLTSMGQYVFSSCSSLTNICLPNSLSYIDTGILSHCSEELIAYGTLGSYANTYCNNNSIIFYGYEDSFGSGVMGRTYYRQDGSVYSITYYNGSNDSVPKIQADYYDEDGVMFFTEQFGDDGTIVASIWFHEGTIIPSVKNYYDDGTLYFQEEYDTSNILIASVSYHADGVSRYFKNYYDNGTMYFQEEYDTNGEMIASIWFQSDGVTRNFKNYYSEYLYFQEEYNTSGTMIASIDFRADNTRERKCYYRVEDGSLYLIEYYDENEICIDSEWY